MKDLSHITEDQCKEIAKIVSPVFYSSKVTGSWKIFSFEQSGMDGAGLRIKNRNNDYKLDFDFEIPQDIELVNIYMGCDAGRLPISGGQWVKILGKLQEWGLYLKQNQI